MTNRKPKLRSNSIVLKLPSKRHRELFNNFYRIKNIITINKQCVVYQEHLVIIYPFFFLLFYKKHTYILETQIDQSTFFFSLSLSFSFQMAFSRLTRLITLIVLIFAIIYGWKAFFETRQPPCYTVDVKYFGPGNAPSTDDEDLSIKPFKVPFDRPQVEDMIDRVRKTRFYGPEITVDNRNANRSTYGFNRQTAESVREYLLNTFDWKKTVEELNQLEHFKTNIAVSELIRLFILNWFDFFSQGLNIHFVRMRNNPRPNEKQVAIIFLHGWPGSFLEYLDAARNLISSPNANYDIIIPSLPGYGYSDAAAHAGMNPTQMARIMQNLMLRLGHSTYVVCGGDWGSIIGTIMAQLYPGHVRGLLVTMVFSNFGFKHFLHMAAAHLISPSILLDHDEQAFLEKRYDALDALRFMW